MVKSGKKCRERIGCARQRHDRWFCDNKSVFVMFFHVCKDHWALMRRNILKGGRAGVDSTEIGGIGYADEMQRRASIRGKYEPLNS